MNYISVSRWLLTLSAWTLTCMGIWATAPSRVASTEGDVNGDGVVSVADINAIIDLMIDGQYAQSADVNGDQEISIADINLVISIILQDDVSTNKVVGGDLSMLTTYEAHQRLAQSRYAIGSAHYYDVNGQVIDDVITFVKQQGWNAARVRLFVNPENASAEDVGEGVIQNLDTVVGLGQRIKQAGMRLMLDFHYSDTWADPAQQYTPAAWATLDDEALAQQVYDYTRSCLETLVAAGATPDYIQTGNEISYGMLWGPVGTASSALKRCYSGSNDNWERLATLLSAAIRACREVCPRAQIILHNERVAKPSVLLNFYNQMSNYSVDYDIIGLSYYPYYHGSLSTLATAINGLQQRYADKHIMIVETGYSYHYALGDLDYSSTWPLTSAGQQAYVSDLITTLKQYDAVDGLFWWFPEANEYGFSGSNWNTLHVTTSWYNAGLWNHETGKALPALYDLKSFLE